MADALKTLGLAYRARKTVLGEEVLNRIGKVKSRERYEKKCYYYGIDHIDDYLSKELSEALGKNNVKVIGILDEGFKDALLKK